MSIRTIKSGFSFTKFIFSLPSLIICWVSSTNVDFSGRLPGAPYLDRILSSSSMRSLGMCTPICTVEKSMPPQASRMILDTLPTSSSKFSHVGHSAFFWSVIRSELFSKAVFLNCEPPSKPVDSVLTPASRCRQ